MQQLADSEFRWVLIWTLAGTLLWSGSSKLRSPLLAGTALTQFALVKGVSPRSGQALGIAELGLAALLISGLAPRFGLGAATALFTAFAFLIATRLRAGDTRPCYCFGSDAPTGIVALSRAIGLAVTSFVLGVTAPTWGTLPGFNAIGWYAAGAAALIGIAALTAAITTAIRLTSADGGG